MGSTCCWKLFPFTGHDYPEAQWAPKAPPREEGRRAARLALMTFKKDTFSRLNLQMTGLPDSGRVGPRFLLLGAVLSECEIVKGGRRRQYPLDAFAGG